jgi:hypothetical protein
MADALPDIETVPPGGAINPAMTLPEIKLLVFPGTVNVLGEEMSQNSHLENACKLLKRTCHLFSFLFFVLNSISSPSFLKSFWF